MFRLLLQNGRLDPPTESLDLGTFVDSFDREGKGGYEGKRTLNAKAAGVENAQYVLVAWLDKAEDRWYSADGKGPFMRVRTLPPAEEACP